MALSEPFRNAMPNANTNTEVSRGVSGDCQQKYILPVAVSAPELS